MQDGHELRGGFIIRNEDGLRKRMARLNDGRLAFYDAMLTTNTYEEYLAAVGTVRVTPRGRKDGPFSGVQEIRYARKRGWIADVTPRARRRPKA